MNFREIVFWSVVFVIVVSLFAFSVLFIKSQLVEKESFQPSPSPLSSLSTPPSVPSPSKSDQLCLVGTDTQCPLCHTSPDPVTEIQPSARGADFSVFVNKRDGYSLEFSNKLKILGIDLHPFPHGGFWSAIIGYGGHNPAFQSSIGIACGNIQAAEKDAFQQLSWLGSAFRIEDMAVDGKKAQAVYIKRIGGNTFGRDSVTYKVIFVEKANGTTLILVSPFIEEGEDSMKLFDDIVTSLRFLK